MQATRDEEESLPKAPMDLLNVHARHPEIKAKAIIEFSSDMTRCSPTTDPTSQELDPAWRSWTRTSQHSIRRSDWNFGALHEGSRLPAQADHQLAAPLIPSPSPLRAGRRGSTGESPPLVKDRSGGCG